MSDYIPELPDELLAATILWRLPVKSILQCRCVCKSWYFLITSPNFISTHLRKTLTKNPQIFLNKRRDHDTTGTCLLLFDRQDYFHSMLFHLLTFPDHSIHIIGSVNGLICFSICDDRDRIFNLILCNPSIGHFQSIPQPYGSVIYWAIRGFGFDERTLDYNILLISNNRFDFDNKFGFIYSLNSNSWRSIPMFRMSWAIFPGQICFVNGRFHWLVSSFNRNFIVFFDLKTEAIGHISLPECIVTNCFLKLLVSGESSIAIFHTKSNEKYVWILKEYGSVDSWMTFELASYPRGEVFGFRNKDEVLIRLQNGGISSQKINNNKLEKVKKLTDVFKQPSLLITAHQYVPSLVLLDKENNVDVAGPTHTIVDIAAPTRRKRDIAAATRRKRTRMST